jgi:hypothetical protein
MLRIEIQLLILMTNIIKYFNWGILFALIIAVSVISFKWLIGYISTYPCPEPEKPPKVPREAVYFGGCDGGHWFYFPNYQLKISESENQVIPIEIYNTWEYGESSAAYFYKFKDVGCLADIFMQKGGKNGLVLSYNEQSSNIVLRHKGTDNKCILEPYMPITNSIP